MTIWILRFLETPELTWYHIFQKMLCWGFIFFSETVCCTVLYAERLVTSTLVKFMEKLIECKCIKTHNKMTLFPYFFLIQNIFYYRIKQHISLVKFLHIWIVTKYQHYFAYMNRHAHVKTKNGFIFTIICDILLLGNICVKLLFYNFHSTLQNDIQRTKIYPFLPSSYWLQGNWKCISSFCSICFISFIWVQKIFFIICLSFFHIKYQ